MSHRFADLLRPPSPSDLEAYRQARLDRSAVISVQMSLWRRLHPGRSGADAGALSWLLIRLAQPDHRDHVEACRAISACALPHLAALLSIVRGARDAARSGPARELAARIAWRLDPDREGDPWRYDPEAAAWADEFRSIADSGSPRALELVALLSARGAQ